MRCRVNVQEGQRSGGGQRSGRVNVQEGQHSGEGQRSGGGQRSGRGQHCGGQDRVNILGVNVQEGVNIQEGVNVQEGVNIQESFIQEVHISSNFFLEIALLIV